MTILHGNDAFSILVFSTKKGYSSFFKKTFRFSKICFKVKVLKTFKTFTDCHMKICHLSKGGLFWKSLVPFFRKTYTLSVGFEKKPPRKSIFQCLNKNQPNFCSKTCWKEQPFIFTVYLMNHVFQAPVLIIRDNKQIFHAVLFNIRNYSLEVINIQWREAELNIALPRGNNFDIKQKRHEIFVLLYATNTKQDLGRYKLTKHIKFQSTHESFW